MNDKKIIKKLAKESLKTKWKVMKKERNLEDKTVIISDDCAFCIYYHTCQDCALDDSGLCSTLDYLEINTIIKRMSDLYISRLENTDDKNQQSTTKQAKN